MCGQFDPDVVVVKISERPTCVIFRTEEAIDAFKNDQKLDEPLLEKQATFKQVDYEDDGICIFVLPTKMENVDIFCNENELCVENA